MQKKKVLNWFLTGLLGICMAVLVQLGNWQLARLEWKQNLIAAVEARAFGEALEPPSVTEDPQTIADEWAYQRVSVTGNWIKNREIAVKAVTGLGPGYWIMSPFRQLLTGDIIWINRGYVPARLRAPESRENVASGTITLTGLIRKSEPDGTLLQTNEPNNNLWFSRDTKAFSDFFKLEGTSNYFIDLEADETEDKWPMPGLTKVTFRNNHLQYALTWYTMALLLLGGTLYVIRLAFRE